MIRSIWHSNFHNHVLAPLLIRPTIAVSKLGKLFTGPTKKLFLSVTVISGVYRFFIPNQTTFTKYCLTWELWNPQTKAVPDKVHESGEHRKHNCLQLYCAVCYCGYIIIGFAWLIYPYITGLIHLHFPAVDGVTLMDIGTCTNIYQGYFIQYNHNKTKHITSACIFDGMYCVYLLQFL